MKNFSIYRSGGMTLVEIMVAVGITVGMLLLIGSVFKSATDSSGSALANNEAMAHLRVLTAQLEQDFSGVRPDLPLAIIFEAHTENSLPDWGDPDERRKVIRYDRISFFANGNFQDTFGTALSGNLARIFYGQMLNSPQFSPGIEVQSPRRQILARRQKIMTAVNDAWILQPSGFVTSGLPGEQYDYRPFETGSARFWKNEIIDNYIDFYFNQAAVVSFVRPPDYASIQDAIAWGTVNEDALQPMYFLPDVTDLKIQLYLFDNSPTQQRWRWFPTKHDFIEIEAFLGVSPLPSFALYWNVPGPDIPGLGNEGGLDEDLDGTVTETPVAGHIRGIGYQDIPWFSNLDAIFAGVFPDTWPRAIKFTFTLYDENRVRFPDGQTFSYIMKIPSRY